MAFHFLKLYSPQGVHIRNLAFKSINVTLNENSECVLTLGLYPYYPDNLFQWHCRIAYERMSEQYGLIGTKLVGNTVWLVTDRKRMLNSDGTSTIVLTCAHPNTILKSRVIAYDPGSAEADQEDLASDVVDNLIDQNFINPTDTARALSSTHFVLDPIPSFGPTVAIEASYQNVLEVIQNIIKQAQTVGEYVGFEVYVEKPPGPFHLRFYKDVRGVDRGLTSPRRLVLNQFRANVSSGSALRSWKDIATFVYSAGAGQEDEALIDTAQDDTLLTQSPFGRQEMFQRGPWYNPSMVLSQAESVLRAYRPRDEMTLTVAPGAGLEFGFDYDWGDILAGQFSTPIYTNGVVSSWTNYQMDCRVNPVQITVTADMEGESAVDRDSIVANRYTETLNVTLQSVPNSTTIL